jgi:nucleotide-binding universal stress UspA family protein
MFKRILVAVDGSSTSDQALQEAIKLAKELQAQLRIVHAVDLRDIYLSADFVDPLELSNVVTKSGQEVLRKAQAVAESTGITVETRLLKIEAMGQRIPEMIAADAQAWPADLIVICTHGRSGLSRLLMGSVAEGVVRVATKPVLLVRAR